MSKDSRAYFCNIYPRNEWIKERLCSLFHQKVSTESLNNMQSLLQKIKSGVNVFILMCIKVCIKSAASSNLNPSKLCPRG